MNVSVFLSKFWGDFGQFILSTRLIFCDPNLIKTLYANTYENIKVYSRGFKNLFAFDDLSIIVFPVHVSILVCEEFLLTSIRIATVDISVIFAEGYDAAIICE
jgi:hypothetical protein